MSDFIHIVCFDAPAPPDYGGAVDMYYKIIALAQQGKRILLHYFDYTERNVQALLPYCDKIYRYKRSGYLLSCLRNLPYIVSSRINKVLISNLNKDNFPIIAEGLHCSGIVPYLQNKQRKIIVRVHNNESVYYSQLFKTERHIIRRFYFIRESNLLRNYQRRLPDHVCYAALSQEDEKAFKQQYSLPHVQFIPCFVPWQPSASLTGFGDYCLYHGNMSVSENEGAAAWLIDHVFSKAGYEFIIAGKGISTWLQKKAVAHSSIKLIHNPDSEEMDQLIAGAHIHVLPSLNNTGVKLKLLHALFKGRYCITNTNGVAGSGLAPLVHIAETEEEVRSTVEKLRQKPFTKEESEERAILLARYNNEENADRLITWLCSHCQ